MISPALFFKELVENRIKFWISFFILGVLAVIIPLLYAFAGNMLGSINLSPYVNPGEISFILSSYPNYAWSQWTAKNLTQFASLAAIVLGMGALAGETAYGTAPFLLSKPLTRRQVYATKMAAGIFLLGLAIVASTFLLILVSAMKGYTLQAGPFIASAIVVYVGAAVIYLGTAVISTIIPDPVKAGVVAAIFWGLASVPGYFRGTVQYSIFYQMKAIRYWLQGEFPWLVLILWLGIGFLLFETGVYYWRQKDF
ncbi:MAG: ABC transporter permease subunit [Bacillota bacterium]